MPNILTIKIGWNWMKTGSSSLLKISTSENLHRMTMMTPNQTQGIWHQKYPTYVHCSTYKIKWQITKKSHSLYSFMTNILTIKFGWNQMKIGISLSFENHKIGNFAKCTKWPQTKRIKTTLHMYTVVPRVTNFRPFRSMISQLHILGFFHRLPCWNFKVPQNF